MEMTDLASGFEMGNLYLAANNEENGTKPWNAHPTFKGVYLKHILTGSKTNGTLSTHLVKIDNGCIIGEHMHEGKTELHEVIAGSGSCIIGDMEVTYNPGDSALIPGDTPHKVLAGETGLFLLAKFIPALL